MLVEASLPTMAKNYSHCPLKKRPVYILHEGGFCRINYSNDQSSLFKKVSYGSC